MKFAAPCRSLSLFLLAAASFACSAEHAGPSGTRFSDADALSIHIVPEYEPIPLGANRLYHAVVTVGMDTIASSDVTWFSSNPEIVAVDRAGLATAVGHGSAEIIAMVQGVADSLTVSTINEGIVLQVLPSAADMMVGDDIEVEAALADVAGKERRAVRWSSSDTSVATVSRSGRITAHRTGTADITARLGTSTAQAAIRVGAARDDVLILLPMASSVLVGERVKLRVAGLSITGALVQNPRGARSAEHSESTGERSVTWRASDSTVVSVDSLGNVTGLQPGSATIAASLNGKTARARVMVKGSGHSRVAGVKVRSDDTVLDAGKSTQAAAIVYDAAGQALPEERVTWASLDTSIAVVSAQGMITARNPGSATIVATSGTESDGLAIVVNSTSTAPVATITVSLSPTSIAGGQTAQATATLRDAQGQVLTGRTLTYVSLNTAVATVSSGGVVTGVSKGEARIRVTSEGVSGGAWMKVTSGSPTVSRVVVSAPATTIAKGTSVQATATLYDAAGNRITAPVTWSSSNASVASVNTAGLISGVAAGSATIKATAGGVTGSLGVTVTTTAPAPVATVSVSLGASSLVVGQTAQLTTIARDAAGNVLAGQSFTYSSSNTNVATTSTTGEVAALAAGTSTVSATAAGIVGTVAITVTTTQTIPPPAGSIPLSIQRFDGLSGSVLVSTGIPLIKGALMPGQLANLRVLVNGVEQSLYVEATAGRHSDGSLRTVLVQFNYSVPATGSIPGSLVLGQTRQTADLAKPSYNRTTIGAVALPTDANYLVATELNGPTITTAQSNALGQPFLRYEADFVNYANKHWAADGANWGANYYDRALIYYAFWVRTGNPLYFYRGARHAIEYRTKYLEANAYATSPHWQQIEGIEQHYLLSGDPKSHFAVARVAEQMKGYPLADTTNTPWMESRIQARALQAIFTAWRINAKGPANLNLPALLDASITKVLSTQRADGSFGWPVTCDYSLNYMNGLLDDVLIKIHTYYRADPRLVQSVKRNADYLWAKEWIGTSGAFKYISNNCTSSSGYIGGPTPAPDLNGLMVTAFGWIYQQTGVTSYRTAADAIFKGGVTGAWLSGSKQFNQEYSASYRYLSYRR